MALQLIGAGWGRTGTVSTRIALERLGFRSHHMRDVFANIDQADLFVEAADDPDFDWERIYRDYTATLDWPGCAFWRELLTAYPDAKVLLNVRDPHGWFESYTETIYEPIANGWDNDDTGRWNPMVQRVIVQRSFRGEPHDRDHLVETLRRHNDEVRATVPPDRLLVYRVEDGWAPLCEFLDRPVPDEPFPHANPREQWGSGSGRTPSRQQ